jgi:hypothetical protein
MPCFHRTDLPGQNHGPADSKIYASPDAGPAKVPDGELPGWWFTVQPNWLPF